MGRRDMGLVRIFSLAGVVAILAAPAMAAESMMGSMSMMKGGETVAVMPDGHMGTMMMNDAKMTADWMKMAKPLDHCMMMMAGADGKMYVVDTSSQDMAKECEKMAK
jgi:hypothetical protein